jgi:diguanylate cyclase (GGDEF)-like protein
MNYKLLSEVALAFVDQERFDVQLGRALKLLCTGFQLSRAYVFLNGKERADMGPIHEWCAEGVATQWMQDIPYSSYASWKRMLAKDGRIVSSDIASLPDDLRAVLEPHGLQSLMVFPIEIEHEIGGFASFDDCLSPRSWSDEEIELLQSASRIISAFCERERMRGQMWIGDEIISKGIEENAIHDALTGLHTMPYVLERLKGFDAEYARLGRNFCISVIDLDNFKTINYSYGREAGDHILKEFASIINGTIRPYDIGGRYGGEEFIIVSVNSSATETVFLIERIMKAVRGSAFTFNGMEIRLRFSCGIASSSEFTPEDLSIDKLVEMANRRMYAAKQGGRDNIVVPSPGA